MNKISAIVISLVLGVTLSWAGAPQNLQIFSVNNSKGAINAKSIEAAFNASDVVVDVNNNMNSIFEKRYGNVHHKNYNLAIFSNHKMVVKLAKKYPNIGLITPLSMSIYSNDADNSINISTLSLAGMSRITKIPVTNPDLIEYARLVNVALHKALPNGKFLTVKHSTNTPSETLVSEFTTEFELEDGTSYMDAKDEFLEEFEGELSPVGFLVPKSYNLQEELFTKNGLNDYDFFDTYSIIRFNAIFPVSKNHPDAGAYAPFSLVIYKKKDEDSVHVAFPSLTNWVNDLDIKDKETIKAVNETHEMIQTILEELTE